MMSEKIGFYFGSQTGWAEAFCRELHSDAIDLGLQGDIIDLAEVTKESFLNYRYIILCMATHYNGGNPTDNSDKFWAWFSDANSHEQTWLDGFKFSVFSLGDTRYANFRNLGREADRLLAHYGAQRMHWLGIESEEKEGASLDPMSAWKEELREVLKKEFSAALSPSMIDEDNWKPSFEFSTTISSFSKEKTIFGQRKDGNEYNFKTRKYLDHDPLKIGRPS